MTLKRCKSKSMILIISFMMAYFLSYCAVDIGKPTSTKVFEAKGGDRTTIVYKASYKKTWNAVRDTIYDLNYDIKGISKEGGIISTEERKVNTRIWPWQKKIVVNYYPKINGYKPANNNLLFADGTQGSFFGWYDAEFGIGDESKQIVKNAEGFYILAKTKYRLSVRVRKKAKNRTIVDLKINTKSLCGEIFLGLLFRAYSPRRFLVLRKWISRDPKAASGFSWVKVYHDGSIINKIDNAVKNKLGL